MSSKKHNERLYMRIIKVLGFFLFSLILGVGLGYLLITFANFDIVHRKGTTSSVVYQNESAVSTDKLAMLPDTVLKNIILFIGDGMGLGQITATRYRYFGPSGKLNMERMPVTGLLTTYAADGALITDSGAGGTALSTGHKTGIGMVGVTPDGKKKQSIMEALQARGYATGIVTTSEITDATPGAFASHVASRKMKMAIMKQLIENKINLLVSGGETFHGKELEGEEKQTVQEFARANGYEVVDEEQAFYDADQPFILALFEGMASDKLGDKISFNDKVPNLAESTRKAIELLKNRGDGFFLVVEEEGVDSGSHINRIDYVTQHLKRLDDAVEVGLNYALQDQQTLVLVMADHETGGLTLVEENSTKDQIGVRWSTDGHTGQPVPLFAFGPHAVRFSGVSDNTEVPRIIANLMGIEEFPEQERE